jgi:phosphoesterase RecJ-like protein
MECSLKEIAAKLKEAQTVVLTAHIHPDGDSLGSMLALYHYLVAIGKNVQILVDDDIPSLFRYLPGIESVQKLPASGWTSADCLVVLDASDLERIGNVPARVKAPIINIDHHISNTRFADYWVIDSKAAATGEIIYQLLTLSGAQIDTAIAICLYTAIATDCGFFQYANTSAQTMRIAAELIECGVQPHLIAETLETKPFENIALLTKALATLERYADGRIASITLTADMLRQSDNTEGLINYPRCIEGVEVAVLFKVLEEGYCRVSLRSKTIDVSQVALQFGGGGHVRAAGCTLTGAFPDVKQDIIAVLAAKIREYALI